MTANYKLDSMIEIRKFLWSQFMAYGIFDVTEYYSDNLGETIIPIIPVQQAPEMNQFLSGKKHLVYDKIGMSYDDNWMICTEQILFTTYALDISEIIEVRNIMVDLFRRMDESAESVNRFPSLSDKFIFHTIHIADISPTEPSSELQGFLSADVIIEVKYSRILDGVGRYL